MLKTKWIKIDDSDVAIIVWFGENNAPLARVNCLRFELAAMPQAILYNAFGE